jgi:hypothetical protein
MAKAHGSKLATPMTPLLRVGKTSSAPSAVASVTYRSNLRNRTLYRQPVYRPVSAMVSRIGIFRALHNAARFVSRGRTRPLSQ